MSDTPRVDVMMKFCFGNDDEFIRRKDADRLDRELTEAKANAESWHQQCEDARALVLRLGEERDGLKATLELQKRGTENAERILCEALDVSSGSEVLDAIGRLKDRIKRLEEALNLASNMWIDWTDNRYEDGCSGAYYAFVKHHQDEWDVIMKAKEAKP